MRFEEIKKQLSSKTVGIAGAGGLGSNCAVALARVGIGHLIIVDFDVILESNLNRQYFFYDQIGMKKVEALKINLLRINPNLKITAIDKKLDFESIEKYFAACDVLVEAFDKAEMKQMIIEATFNFFSEKPLVCAMGLAGFGNLEDMKIQKFDNLYICGDNKTEVSDDLPPIAPRVAIAANMQADTVLNILLTT
ncbi:MAG TPA: sulfur carrier protein ThiS adenylyltransferase ThiF [Bacteroidetes bacterium]|nr:sulfur carrier protein ThiS adenylyltransferase ThiF [Bacteroidota bacterium]